jgi:two-component system chemotaxis sensor kinase CheA
VSDGFDPTHFIAGFVSEAEEHLRLSVANLLSVEQAAANLQATPRQVRELFRSLHTIKGLAAMIGVEPIVDIAHAMEAVLREADRAAGKLPDGAVDLLLKGLRAIEQRVHMLAKRNPVAPTPAGLITALNALRQSRDPPRAASVTSSLPAELWVKLSAAEREQLAQGISDGRRALLLRFLPSPSRALAGINITSVREQIATVAEIVKVVPQSVAATEEAPGGLAFALILLTTETDATLAAAGGTTPDALVPVVLQAVPEVAAEIVPDVVVDSTADFALDDDLGGTTVQGRGIVRVEVSRLDDALERLSALVVTQFRLTRTVAAMREAGSDVRALAQVILENGRQLRDLRASIMRARMVAVTELLERVPLIVRGLSRATGKEARLEIVAGKTELDKAVAERIVPAIVHLVRNAVDHALESPGERRAAGKPEVGLVSAACFERSDNQLELTISDDGRGIDAAAVARRAGVAVPTNDDALLQLLVRPGLSTKTEVTTTSGRGVGMDVVNRIVSDLRGELSMRTTVGQGTSFTMRIPLSITIVDAFSFLCGGETFVVPVAMVEEIQEVDLARTVRGPDRRRMPRAGTDRRRAPRATDMMERRGEAVPVLRLDEIFGLVSPADIRRKAIIVRRNGEPFAFVVDRMLGQQEVVVRPLDDQLVRVSGVSGTTDLGDGRPTLVLDLAALGGKLLIESSGAPA